MNKITHTLHTLYIAVMSSPRAALYGVVFLLVLGAGAFLLSSHRSTSEFGSDYVYYNVLAKTHEDAAYLLAAPNNPIRQELNKTLSEVLGKKMTAQSRLSLAKQGLDLAAETETQMEAVTAAGDEVDSAIAKMQVDMLNSFSTSQQAREVVALAKKRSAIISDIRAYSYRADLEVRKIFDHIIADGGALSDAYIIELNTALPDLEEQFNKRSSLYADLQRTGEEMQRKIDGAAVR